MIHRAFQSISKSLEIPKHALMATLAIPVGLAAPWKQAEYSHVPKNEVSFSKPGLLIQVNKSASPLIYPLNSPLKIIGFKVRGEFKGLPIFKDVSKQGEKGADDYPFRIGFIVPGEKRLTVFKKMFASAWVKHLYSAVPPGTGLDHIQFFDVSQNLAQVGQGRIHPSSDLVREEFFSFVKGPGPFELEYMLRQPLETVALWISIDGDDTKSKFDVLISELELKSEDLTSRNGK
ncbi:MAG: hypothetical protein AB7K68_17265 [Bacteriovoracia bacterium]